MHGECNDIFRTCRLNTGVLALALLGVPLSGCIQIERALWKSQYLDRTEPMKSLRISGAIELEDDKASLDEAPRTWRLTQETVAERVTGSTVAGRVVVAYPEVYAAYAPRVAELIDLALAGIQQELGLEIGFGLRVILLETDSSYSKLQFELPVEIEAETAQHRATYPMFVREPTSSADEIVAQLDLQLFVMLHELVESTLAMPMYRPTALPDADYALLGPLMYRSRNHTRWFRDGLSNYASMVALEAVEHGAGAADLRLRQRVSDQPFLAALDRVGAKLLRWDQFDPVDWNGDYYAAATGVFLLIEHRHGRSAVREILQRVGELDFPGGSEIEDAVSGVLGEDLSKVMDSFRFPDTGLTLVRHEGADRDQDSLLIRAVHPASAAARAGLRPADLITHLNGRLVRNVMDYELALLIATEVGSESVAIKAIRPGRDGAADERLEVMLPVVYSDSTVVARRPGRTSWHVRR